MGLEPTTTTLATWCSTTELRPRKTPDWLLWRQGGKNASLSRQCGRVERLQGRKDTKWRGKSQFDFRFPRARPVLGKTTLGPAADVAPAFTRLPCGGPSPVVVNVGQPFTRPPCGGPPAARCGAGVPPAHPSVYPPFRVPGPRLPLPKATETGARKPVDSGPARTYIAPVRRFQGMARGRGRKMRTAHQAPLSRERGAEKRCLSQMA